ncbi:MAG TPA: uroporphyrinogen decarboxylase family protein [Candidatus Aminicenantes bacterium]|nr:uroporphyrinogen decarboxylase family protein [Candidatus Aminicenantes bacterium]
MTSRELVVDTLEFRGPARVPRQLWTLPWAEMTWPAELAALRARFPDDIVSSPAFLREPPRTEGEEYEPGVFVDEWGCRFENAQRGIIGQVKEPRLRDWSGLDGLRVPRERLTVDLAEVDGFCAASGAFVLAKTGARPFELLQSLRGPENLYVDLAERPKGLFRLIDAVHAFFREEMELWASTEVDALVFADDWGGQTGLLVAPGLWRELFKPLYREYVEIAHRNGKYAFMHSDGHIAAILPDLVEIGLDALNAQIFCMDVAEIGRRFAGKLTFWGEVDRQRLLPSGTPAEVAAAVGEVHRALWRGGGAIAQCEFGPGARPENVAAVFEAWEALTRPAM